jgi:glutamate 5-kinase
VEGKRLKKQQLPAFTPPPELPAGLETNIDKIFEMEEELVMAKENKVAKKFKVLDRVKIKTTRFGKTFARGKPIYTFGTIMKMKGKVCDKQPKMEKKEML